MAKNARFWKGVAGGWIAVSVILMVVHGGILDAAYNALQAQGFLRGPETAMTALVAVEILFLVAVYLQSEFLEKLSQAGRLNYLRQGAQFGLFYSLPAISQWVFFNIPGVVAAVSTVGNLLAFIAAAYVYERLAVPKALRAAARKARRR
jgi:hypothetical protein